MVLTPTASSSSPFLRPSPGSRLMESGASVSTTRSGATTVSPSGLSRSDAIFATSLFGATPTEALRPVRSRIKCLISRAIEMASPFSARLAVTSR